MTITGKVHAVTSQPRMLVTNEIDNKLTKDPALKELKQLVEGGPAKTQETGQEH